MMLLLSVGYGAIAATAAYLHSGSLSAAFATYVVAQIGITLLWLLKG